MAYLEIKNFCKSFGDNLVLKGVDLSVEKGEVVSYSGDTVAIDNSIKPNLELESKIKEIEKKVDLILNEKIFKYLFDHLSMPALFNLMFKQTQKRNRALGKNQRNYGRSEIL